MTDTLTIRRPDDFHVHFRQGEMLLNVIRFTAELFARALIMPNLRPKPVLTGEDVEHYRAEILQAKDSKSGCESFEPLMTIQITDDTTPDMINEAFKAATIAGKVYMRGVTTNSENGVTVEGFYKLAPVWQRMAELGIIVSLHGEVPDPGVFCLDREKAFLKHLRWLAAEFPQLKIVLEHTTTEEAVSCVMELGDNVAATITAHHLGITLDNVVGGSLAPHNFCKPVAKRPQDRMALRNAATSGQPKFFFGSDAAPHLRGNKECASGCAGVWSAPVALPYLAQIFEEEDALDKLELFTSHSGAMFYELNPNQDSVQLVREEWVVPEELHGIVPFMAGKKLRWKLA